MAEFGINLNEVEYKPPLPVAEYTFAIISASPEQAKEPNKKSGEREWYIKCELKPLEVEGYVVFHMWSLSNAALQVENPVVSLKKMYEVMGAEVGSKINTDDLLAFRFVARTKHETYNGRINPKLDAILSKAE